MSLLITFAMTEKLNPPNGNWSHTLRSPDHVGTQTACADAMAYFTNDAKGSVRDQSSEAVSNTGLAWA